MFCMDVFLHKLVYEGIKRSEWKNFLREGEDMKKFGKKIAGFLLAAVTLEVADEDNYYFSGTASKDFRLTLSDSAKNGYGKAEYVKAVKKNDRSTVELTFRLTFDKKTTASTTSTV